MGHACSHPWHLGCNKRCKCLLLKFCSTYTSACLMQFLASLFNGSLTLTKSIVSNLFFFRINFVNYVPPWCREMFFVVDLYLVFVYIFLWCVITPRTKKRPSSNVNDEQMVKVMKKRLKVESRPTSRNNNPPQHLLEVVPRHACI
jgi:predicted membrane protein